MVVYQNDKCIEGELISQNKNMKNIRFTNSKDGSSRVLTNVYPPNSKWSKKALREDITNHRKKILEENWIIMGHFNTPLKESKLNDMDLHGINYNWTNRRTGKDLIQVRLDRALISSDWFLKYKCSLTAQVCIGSDHYPIFLMVDLLTFQMNYPFRFEKMWTLHPSLENLIKEWWSIRVEGTAMFKVAAKLKNVLKNIKIWNKETFGNIFQNKKKVLEELKDNQDSIQADGYENVSREEESVKLTKIHDIITKEEMFWRQRSRKKKLKEGDQNTKYFHMTTLKHRMDNKTSRLNTNGGSMKDDEIIKRDATIFFQ